MSRTLHLFGTDWCAMMVPIQVIRWYRMQCYDGTDSCAIVVPIRRYCQKMEIAYKNGTAFREIPVKEEYGLSMLLASGFLQGCAAKHESGR